MLTLSLIIPVYNEERHMKACLDAVSRQTVMPDEVIVVNNNCSDRTIEIAKSYPFVTIIKQKTQGLIPARNLGFETATSDILGRIDADSQIHSDWVARVKAQFSANPDISGVTGYGRTDIIPYSPWPRSVVFSVVYFWYIQVSTMLQVLWGANMAIRSDAWKQIRNDICMDDNVVHEDQDISIIMLANDMKLQLDGKLRITTSGQVYRYLPKTLFYRRLHLTTKQFHERAGTLQKAQKNTSTNFHIPIKVVVSLPIVLYLWSCSILLFPVDYSIRRIMRGK